MTMKRNALLILMTAFLLGACGQDDDQAVPDEEEMGQMSEEAEMAEPEKKDMEAPEPSGAGEESTFEADADNDGTLDYEINVIDHGK